MHITDIRIIPPLLLVSAQAREDYGSSSSSSRLRLRASCGILSWPTTTSI